MLPIDETTFSGTLRAFCIDCGSGKISHDEKEPPFFMGKLALTIPMVCKKCGYSFNIDIAIKNDGMIDETNKN